LKDERRRIHVFPRPTSHNVWTHPDRWIRIEPLGHVLLISFRAGVPQEWREGIGFNGRQRKRDNDQQDDSLHGGSISELGGPTASKSAWSAPRCGMIKGDVPPRREGTFSTSLWSDEIMTRNHTLPER
jgi:hypothetical protein